MFVLSEHEDEIADNGVLFTPDGQTLISAGEDGTVRVWDVAGQKLRRTLRGHQQFVSGVCLVPGTSLVVSGSWDEKVIVWDLATGKRVKTFNLKASVIAVDASPDGKTVAAVGGEWWILPPDAGNGAWCWDVKTWKRLPTVGEHYTQVGTVRYSPDGKQIITGAADRLACVWDVESGELLAKFTHTGWVQGLAVSGRTLASAAGRRVTLWSLPTKDEPGRQLEVLTPYRGTALTVAFSPDGRLLATGGKDGCVRIWDMELKRWDRAFRWKIGEVKAVAFSPDGMMMAAGGGEGDIVVWDVD